MKKSGSLLQIQQSSDSNLLVAGDVSASGNIYTEGSLYFETNRGIKWQSGSAHKDISIYGVDGLMVIRSGSTGRHILHDSNTGYVGLGNLNPTTALKCIWFNKCKW